MRYVVDTNVPVVANGDHPEAGPVCRLNTIDFLEELMVRGRLVVDVEGEIETEYWKQLGAGKPGVGNRFLQVFFATAAKRIERVSLAKVGGDFDAFPKVRTLSKFDRSDRKFAALAIVAKAPVANAVDSDWKDAEIELGKYGVVVHFVCGK